MKETAGKCLEKTLTDGCGAMIGWMYFHLHCQVLINYYSSSPWLLGRKGEVTSAFLYSATASSDTASVGCWMEAEFGGMICLPPQDHMYRPCHLPDGNIQ